MAEIGRAQDTLRYELDNSVFLAAQLKQRVSAALVRDAVNADDVALWLRWGVAVRQNLPTLSARAVTAIRDEYGLGSDQTVTDAATAIAAAWGAVQTRLFSIYPRSANGYLESHEWTAADAEPTARVVSPIPAALRTELEAFVGAFTTA